MFTLEQLLKIIRDGRAASTVAEKDRHFDAASNAINHMRGQQQKAADEPTWRERDLLGMMQEAGYRPGVRFTYELYVQWLPRPDDEYFRGVEELVARGWLINHGQALSLTAAGFAQLS